MISQLNVNVCKVSLNILLGYSFTQKKIVGWCFFLLSCPVHLLVLQGSGLVLIRVNKYKNMTKASVFML